MDMGKSPLGMYTFLEESKWLQFVAKENTEEKRLKREQGKEIAKLKKNPPRLGSQGYRGHEAKWDEEVKSAKTSTAVHEIEDPRARHYLLGHTVIVPPDVQEKVKKLQQLSQKNTEFAPELDILTPLERKEHGGRTRAVGYTVGLKKGISGYEKKKRKKRETVKELREQLEEMNSRKEKLQAEVDLLMSRQQGLTFMEEEIHVNLRPSTSSYDSNSRLDQLNKIVASTGTAATSLKLVNEETSTEPSKQPTKGATHSYLASTATSLSSVNKETSTKLSKEPTKSAPNFYPELEQYRKMIHKEKPMFIRAFYDRWMKRTNPKLGVVLPLEEVFGPSVCKECIVTSDDLMCLLTNGWFDMSIITYFTMSLHKSIQKPGNKCALLNPYEIRGTLCDNDITSNTHYLFNVVNTREKDKVFFLAPYYEQILGYIRWILPECHQQNDDWECGFYVMRWMHEFIKFQQDDFSQTIPCNHTNSYEVKDLDNIVGLWLSYFLKICDN